MINVKDSSLFEIACNQILSNKLLVRAIRTPEVLLEIALSEVVPQFGDVDLSERQVQWQWFDCLVDRNAISGQIAKPEERTRSEKVHSLNVIDDDSSSD